MQFSRNQQRSRKKSTQENEKDFLSNLPNEILYIILSLLPTKDAVATSALSRRWLHLWKDAFLPHLQLNDVVTATHKNPPNTHLDYNDEETPFINFVRNVLRGVNLAKLKTVSLSCRSGYYGAKRIFTWLAVACKYNIVELNVHVSFYEDTIRLPPRIYTCNSLVVLKLNAHVKLDLDRFNVCFPSLKVLHMFVYNPTDNDLSSRLYSRCPVLEDLFLEGLTQMEERPVEFSVCSSTLKKLSIDLNFRDSYSGDDFYSVVVRAENLEWLEICDNLLTDYSLQKLQVLDRAIVSIGYSSLHFPDHLDLTLEYYDRAFELLEGLSHVKSLSLSACTVYALSYVNELKLNCHDGNDGTDEFYDNIEERLEPYGHLPTFSFLTYLELDFWEDCSWNILSNILQCAPNLEYLTLEKETLDRVKFCFDRWSWKAPEPLPTCMLNCLKEIEINEFEGKQNELTVVKFLLKNAEVLLRLDICSPPLSSDKKLKLHKTILGYPRGSKACQVRFFSYC